MTDLEMCIGALLGVFDKYAGRDGDPNTLTKCEVRDLVKAELPGLLKDQSGKEGVDKIMKDLDSDGDGLMNFQEFAVLVISISVCCHNCLKEMSKKK
ncbi:protein S100-P-like [Mobula birostris]|uniref:protein S100-P-like n=1 Tax=Mobula birostris TaxID=1983395 RepID=UPI003B2806C8